MLHPVPQTSAEITADWLTQALQASRTITTSRVVSTRLSRIGADEAFTGGCIHHAALTYDGPEPAQPMTLVAKLSPKDPGLRAMMRAANRREVDFYQSLTPGHGLPLPRCYYADFDPETGASIVLLQDLSTCRSVPFMAGCGPADAKSVVEALATLHARWWGSADLAKLSGASMLDEFPFDRVWPHYRAKQQALFDAYKIPGTFFALGDFLAENQLQIFTDLMDTAPLTRLHRDVQSDNVKFGPTRGMAEAILLDWQFVGKGRGAYDVGYFLISSVDPAQRRNMERGLVAHYHAALLRLGVVDYSLPQCWADYIRSVAGKFYLTVAATVLLDNSGPHKKAWRLTDLQRLLAFCSDHRISEKTFLLTAAE